MSEVCLVGSFCLMSIGSWGHWSLEVGGPIKRVEHELLLSLWWSGMFVIPWELSVEIAKSPFFY